jgi:hypothetical protein
MKTFLSLLIIFAASTLHAQTYHTFTMETVSTKPEPMRAREQAQVSATASLAKLNVLTAIEDKHAGAGPSSEVTRSSLRVTLQRV